MQKEEKSLANPAWLRDFLRKKIEKGLSCEEWTYARQLCPTNENTSFILLNTMHGHHCMYHETGGNESRSVGKGGAGGAGGGRRPTGQDDVPFLSSEPPCCFICMIRQDRATPCFMQDRTFFNGPQWFFCTVFICSVDRVVGTSTFQIA